MLVLKRAGLVFLSNPKTAGRSIRNMLAPHAGDLVFDIKGRHMDAGTFNRSWRAEVSARLGAEPETVAVMREPRAHMESWYRFRSRDATRKHSTSTLGIPFVNFVQGRLISPSPAYAQIGRQDRFLGYRRGRPQVTHVFDYARLDLLVDFLSERLGEPLVLPKVNVSPEIAPEALILPEALEARYRAEHAAEFELYAKVAEAGVLVTRD